MNIIKNYYKRGRNALSPLIFILILMGLSFLLQSCEDKCTEVITYMYYEPVYTSLEEIRGSVEVLESREISNPGKIYYLNGYILINQPGEGIHIIDNRNVNNPINKAFVKIPGNFDIAGKGNTIYADSYVDLVILDFSNPEGIFEVGRMEEVFPNFDSNGFMVYDENRGVLTEWKEIEQIESYETNCEGNTYYSPIPFRNGIMIDFAMADMAELSVNPGSQGGNAGIGGSLARFTILGDFLYTLEQNNLKSIDITNQLNPVLGVQLNVGWGLETIFPYKDRIFIGSMMGMHIIDVSNPDNPKYESSFEHILSCDPVVVQDDIAYVTLRSGTTCRNGENRLDIIDVQNTSNPELISTFSMYNPGGLGVDGSLLFICDGDAGLKIFDASDKMSVTSNKVAQYPDLQAIDVIPFNNVLMVIAEDGFYQYDYSDINNISLLSTISIVNEEL